MELDEYMGWFGPGYEGLPDLLLGPCSLSGHVTISINGRYLTYFINPQWHLPTTPKKKMSKREYCHGAGVG